MADPSTIVALDSIPKPKRGDIHPTHGVYLGGSILYNEYKQNARVTYKYARQKCTGKAISSIEDNLIKTCNSTGTLKFNSNLEAVDGSLTEIGKEKFVAMLKCCVVEHRHIFFFTSVPLLMVLK